MTQHTQGPWFHHKAPAIGGGTIHVIQAGQLRGVTVCTIRSGLDNGNSDRVEPVCDANGDLIAAAPAMLEALKSALPHVQRLASFKPTTNDNMGKVIQARKDRDLIEAAIAKAEGRP